MRKLYILLITALGALLAGCDSTPKFEVKGSILGAGGDTLFLEVLGDKAIAQKRLDEKGDFSFKADKFNDAEFLQLRLKGKMINFVVDSTETVAIHANYADMDKDYEITASENNDKIKEMSIKFNQLRAGIDALSGKTLNKQMDMHTYQDSVTTLLKQFKDDMKLNYVFKAPDKLYAYFPLFMTLDGFSIFDPYNSREDVKCFAAVATSMERLHPHSDRTKQLANITLRGMKAIRQTEGRTLFVPEEKVSETGIIDIALRNVKGDTIRLSDQYGKVVLLDFTVQQSKTSAAHNLALRELYDKYAPSGFEIYQVSLDADEHYWRQSTDKLPWICVWTPDGIYSPIVDTYNVTEIPSMYLIDRQSNLVGKCKDMGEAAKETERLVRQQHAAKATEAAKLKKTENN